MPEIIDATAELLLGKKPRTSIKKLNVTGEDGKPVQVEVKLQAIGSTAYDELVAKHPPKKNTGGAFDTDTFGPALLALCMVSPKMDVAQTTELWNNPAWSGGELLGLFNACLELNLADLDVDFTDAG